MEKRFQDGGTVQRIFLVNQVLENLINDYAGFKGNSMSELLRGMVLKDSIQALFGNTRGSVKELLKKDAIKFLKFRVAVWEYLFDVLQKSSSSQLGFEYISKKIWGDAGSISTRMISKDEVFHKLAKVHKDLENWKIGILNMERWEMEINKLGIEAWL